MGSLLGVPFPGGGPDPQPPATHAVAGRSCPQASITRVQGADGGADEDRSTLLRAEFFHVPNGQGESGALVVRRLYERQSTLVWEQDTLLRDGELFLSQHEERTGETTRVVWRELNLGLGVPQTLVADGIGGERGIRILRHGLRSQTHSELAGGHGTADKAELVPSDGRTKTPMALLEEMRGPQSLLATPVKSPVELQLFVPETQTLEQASVHRVVLGPAAGLANLFVGQEPVQYVLWFCAGNGSVKEHLLLGEHLLGFRWRAHSPWAEPMGEASWQNLAGTWRSLARPRISSARTRALEAAAPFLDKRERTRPVWYDLSDL